MIPMHSFSFHKKKNRRDIVLSKRRVTIIEAFYDEEGRSFKIKGKGEALAQRLILLAYNGADKHWMEQMIKSN